MNKIKFEIDRINLGISKKTISKRHALFKIDNLIKNKLHEIPRGEKRITKKNIFSLKKKIKNM